MDIRSHRRLGIAMLLGLTALVVGLQFIRGNHHQDQAMDRAFTLLVQAEQVPAAQRQVRFAEVENAFAHSAAVVSLEPLALLGVALSEQLPVHLGEPAPPPLDPTATDDAAIATHLRQLLERGRVDQALEFASQPHVARRKATVGALVRFAEQWQAARVARRSAHRPR